LPELAPILTIAKLTMWEASRRKLLIAVLVLTVIVVGATGWAFYQLRYSNGPGGGEQIGEVALRLLAAQVLIFVAFLFTAVLALMSVLVAAPSISGDVESNLALGLLARPVRRSEYVLGKWLGLAALIVLYAAGSAILELLVVDWTTGYVPPRPVELIAYVSGVGLILLTLALVLSTRLAGMAAGFIPLACYFMAWVGGILGGAGEAIGNQGLIVTGTVSKLLLPTDGLWRAAVYAMEPASLVATYRAAGSAIAAVPFAATDGPPPAFLVWVAVWFACVIGLTLWSFRRREI